MVIDVVIFIVIVALTMTVLTIIFGGWLVVSMIRGTSRLLSGGSSGRRYVSTDPERRCAHRGCLTNNPPEARFCRRCGTPLTVARPMSSAARRAACW